MGTSEAVAEDSAPVEAEATETVTSEPVVEESAPVEAEVTETATEEEDAPVEDWTKKELVEECKTLGISDKGNKAALIERIKETWMAKKEESPVVEADEIPVTEAEEAAVSEIESEKPEETAVEEIAVEAPETEAAETVKEITDPEAQEPEAIETADAEDFELTITSISDLILKNDNNQMTQKEFFKVFLMGLQQNITTKQKLTKIEKRLEDTDTRLEQLEIVEKAASEAPTAPEVIPVEEAEETPVIEAAEEPVIEADTAPVVEAEEAPAVEAEMATDVIEKEAEEPEDITSQVEKVEKTRTSRKRSQKTSGTQRETKPKRTRVV